MAESGMAAVGRATGRSGR